MSDWTTTYREPREPRVWGSPDRRICQVLTRELERLRCFDIVLFDPRLDHTMLLSAMPPAKPEGVLPDLPDGTEDFAAAPVARLGEK